MKHIEPLTKTEAAALNSPQTREALSRADLLALRDKVMQQRSQRGLAQLDAEIRWRDMNGYA